ncbi:MAG: uridine diphosphate-N-acetylglucosamine-binding protein YvcK [Acidimicrobiia bacterium]
MTGPEIQTQVDLSPFRLDPAGPKVVAIGGGHGLAATLEAVQTYASEITAIVSVADDGGSSGRLTGGMGIPPPGDIRRCLLALTPDPGIWFELFRYRFPGGPEDAADLSPQDVAGHALGNLLLAALTDLCGGNFALAVKQAGGLLGALGTVVPATDRPVQLAADIGGVRVEGQVAVARTPGGIERLHLGPDDIGANPDALEAIAAADQIVLGPGSLFTSVLAVLKVPGITEAVEVARGRIVAVLNLVTQNAETESMTGWDHIRAYSAHAGLTRPGGIVAHKGDLVVPATVERVEIDADAAAGLGWDLYEADVAATDATWPAHDPIKLGAALRNVT